jgi:hypothetical protein
MSDRLAELAERKRLLVARSRLHRLELRHGVHALRRSIATPMTALSIAASPPVRPLLFSALMFVAGRGRLARWLRGAMAVMAAVKVVRAASGYFAAQGERRP